MHEFKERLAFSEGIELSQNAIGVLRNLVSRSVDVKRASVQEDKSGTDYWIMRGFELPPISVDVKHRSFCPILRGFGDDACIETTSVYRGEDRRDCKWDESKREVVGWTLNYQKRTDYIMYTWPAKQGLRFWIVPFHPLCKAARTNWRAWAMKYKERAARNKEYLTLSVYPPRSEIARAIKVLTQGIA